MSFREIITLQFGNYSNYVGCHWWSMQEKSFHYGSQAALEDLEICHDVLFREGINNIRQMTYTPRLLLVDLHGSLKHVPCEGELYGNSLKRNGRQFPNSLPECCGNENLLKDLTKDLPWQLDKMELIVEPEANKNEYQMDLEDDTVANCLDASNKDYNLKDTVETWTDFMYTRFHPRTVNLIKSYSHRADTEVFDTFSAGMQLWNSKQFEEDFCDRIRQYAEECDFMQGFQIICDSYNGFSGLTAQCLMHLNDEYKKTNLVFPVYSPRNTLYENADVSTSDSIRVINSALCFSQFAEQASLFVPLCTHDRVWRRIGVERKIPFLNYLSDNLYQTSAILASYLDTISLSYRLRQASTLNLLPNFCQALNNYGRRLAAAGLALPFPMANNIDLIDYLNELQSPLFNSLTPNCMLSTKYVIENVAVRGIPQSRLKRPPNQASRQRNLPAYRCESVSQMLQFYLQCTNDASLANVAAAQTPLHTSLPFPEEMFDGCVTTSGYLAGDLYSSRGVGERVQTAPSLATVQSSSPQIGGMLQSLYDEAKRVKISRLHRYRVANLEDDDYIEALEALSLFQRNYEDHLEL